MANEVNQINGSVEMVAKSATSYLKVFALVIGAVAVLAGAFIIIRGLF